MLDGILRCLTVCNSLAQTAKRAVAISTLALAMTLGADVRASIWVNEFDYDLPGTDTAEFIEIVIAQSSGINIADVSITLYNGTGGAVIPSTAVFTAGALVNGFQFYSASYNNLIQNGAPDGFALAVSGVLVPNMFLSYEGTFTAVGGPANGLASTDVGVVDNGSASSISLVGTGSQSSDFAWALTATLTPGGVNSGQTVVASTGQVPEASALLVWGTLALCGALGAGKFRSSQGRTS